MNRHENNRQVWIDFWKAFLQARGWDNRILAKHLGLKQDLVDHWVDGDFGISGTNIKYLLKRTSQDGKSIFLETEKRKLIQARLETLDLTRDIYPDIAHACSSEVEGIESAFQISGSTVVPHRPRILVLAPYPAQSSVFLNELLTGITRRARVLDYMVHFVPIEDFRAKETLQDYYHSLNGLTGVIAITCHVEKCTWMDECKEVGIPLVLIHDNITQELLEGRGKIAFFWERMDGLQVLVEHLTRDSHQCRHLRIVTTPYKQHLHRTRKVQAITNMAAKFAIPFDENWHVLIVPEYTYAAGRKLSEELLATDQEVDAILCLQDEIAHGVWDVVKQMQRKVRVTGYDNSQQARDFELTSVGQNPQDIGEEAVNELHNLSHHSEADLVHRHLTHTTAVYRSSCCWPD